MYEIKFGKKNDNYIIGTSLSLTAANKIANQFLIKKGIKPYVRGWTIRNRTFWDFGGSDFIIIKKV